MINNILCTNYNILCNHYITGGCLAGGFKLI